MLVRFAFSILDPLNAQVLYLSEVPVRFCLAFEYNDHNYMFIAVWRERSEIE